MTLEVLEPGLATHVVDFGRPAHRSLGVPVGGAADRAALALGNGLVGNAANTPALEITLVGPTLRVHVDLAAVVFGAPFVLWSDRQSLVANRTFNLAANETLRIGGTALAARAYLCVPGGLAVPTILDSRSALEPVQRGATFPCRASYLPLRSLNLSADENYWTKIRTPHLLRTLDGPQADWFPPLIGQAGSEPPTFTVTPASNRMGLRLRGPALAVPPRELVSEPVCPGSVQVTRDGQCILLGVDGQTIGGYPKIAQVIRADLDLIGQLRPGDPLRFVRVTLDEAEALDRDRRRWLGDWLTRLRIAND